MNFTQYQQDTKRTLPSLGEKLDLCHMVLGESSESGEMYLAAEKHDLVNVLEEIGDKFWYISNYCNLRGYVLEDLYIANPRLEEIEVDAEYILGYSELHNQVKRFIAYGKIIDRDAEERALILMIFALKRILLKNGEDVFKVLENNINKLKIRFPEKFTEENALNRDLEAERKELEK